MSATSEELAAQAEQLQSSISYFRIEEGTAAKKAQPTAAASRAPARAVRPAPAAKSGPQGAAKLIAQVQSAYGNGKADRKGGVSLDLTAGGHDHHDAHFERAV